MPDDGENHQNLSSIGYRPALSDTTAILTKAFGQLKVEKSSSQELLFLEDPFIKHKPKCKPIKRPKS